MKIVVCVKPVVDVNFSLVLDQERVTPLADDVFYRANPADLCASEVAISLHEKYGAELTYLMFGPPRDTEILRGCLAMGGDRAIRIWDERFEGRPAKAYLLAKAIAQLAPDLVMCGSRSLDEGSGETPPTIAEFLAVPQITGVTDLELIIDHKKLVARRKLERGRRESVECSLPALLAFEPGIRQPRYASLPRVLRAQRAPVDVMTPESLGVDLSELQVRASLTTFARRSLPRPRPKKTFNMESGLSAEQRMELLMSGGLRQGKSDLLEGPAPDVAKKLTDILGVKIFKRG